MTTTMELTNEEEKAVLEMRAQRAAERASQERTKLLLEIAHDLFKWQVQHGTTRGLTYSMFTEDYGVSARFDISSFDTRCEVYEHVAKIIGLAHYFVEGNNE